MEKVNADALAGTAAALLAGCPAVAEDPDCACGPEPRYLPCDCPTAGTAACACAVVPYGYITANSIQSPNEKLPVFMTSGITEAQMSTALAAIQDG